MSTFKEKKKEKDEAALRNELRADEDASHELCHCRHQATAHLHNQSMGSRSSETLSLEPQTSDFRGCGSILGLA